MTRHTSLFSQVTGYGQSSDQNEDLVLGLPLESDGRTIYPVFLDPRSSQENGSEPRQIGYMEISEDRSDFTSLEPDNRPPVAIALGMAVLALLLTLWLVRALRGNQSNDRTR